MWNGVSMPCGAARTWAPARLIAASDVMSGKRSDDGKGLVEQGLGTSNLPPTDVDPHRQDPRDGSSGGRRLSGNDQRKAMEKAEGKES